MTWRRFRLLLQRLRGSVDYDGLSATVGGFSGGIRLYGPPANPPNRYETFFEVFDAPVTVGRIPR